MARLAVIAGGLVLLIALALTLVFWPGPKQETGVALHSASFSELDGWPTAAQADALAAFRKSCDALLALPEGASVGHGPAAGRAADWHDACRAAGKTGEMDDRAARAFFERHFRPFALLADGRAEGLFTGYYTPEIAAARQRGNGYDVPVLGRPADLVSVDLGAFRDDLAGRHLAGRVEDGRLVPYASRSEIEAGAPGSAPVLLWARDPVALFFLQIQGSGRARLPDGGVLRLAYAGRNGHPYTALGRLMVEEGILTRDAVSAPAIARWLRANPTDGAELMRRNAAYVFFRIEAQDDEGPRGAQGVALTAGRSLAVDTAHVPLGAPVWLSTLQPDPATDPGKARQPLRRLMVAQDRGSAIRGAVRGDVFFGAGEAAALRAGHMAEPGRMWILLPAALAAKMEAVS